MEDKTEPSCRTDLSVLSDKLMVAAIDFGTTFSGWAYSFKHEFMSDPTNIHAQSWYTGTNISSKSPTVVLIKPDGETFDAFGYEAENKYAELCRVGEHRDWYFFNRFKMMLHDNPKINENILLADASGRSLSAKEVFKHAIKFLKNDLRGVCALTLTEDIKESEVLWVLTVPAVWDEMAKFFLRQAAEEAGILGPNLKIALEPEAAALYCKTLALEKSKEADVEMSTFSPGAKYVVVDAGGGTVDISVHEVLDGGFLKELHKASGGNWGGTKIDEAYRQFLINIFGKAVFDAFKKENMDDYIEIFRIFEAIKRSITKTSDNDTVINLPLSLIEIYTKETGNDFKMAVTSSRYSPLIVFEKYNKLRVKASLMRDLFSETIDNMVVHISKLLQKKNLSGVETVLMAGGLSDCILLQETLRQSFRHLKIIVPRNASLTVLKGAVVFGYRPTVIVERVLQYTYGIKTKSDFRDGIHSPDKLIIKAGRRKCKDIFLKIAECDSSVKTNEKTNIDINIRPCSKSGIVVKLFGSTDASPVYVTDVSCFKVGEVEIRFDEAIPENLNTKFMIWGFFCEVEIILLLEDVKSGRQYISRFVLPK